MTRCVCGHRSSAHFGLNKRFGDCCKCRCWEYRAPEPEPEPDDLDKQIEEWAQTDPQIHERVYVALQRRVARDHLIKACVRWHTSEQDEPNAHYDAELEYCEDMIAAAARMYVNTLARSTDEF